MAVPCDRWTDGVRMTAIDAKRCWNVTLAAAAALAISVAGISLGHAEEEGIDKAKAAAFDVRMFTKPPGKKAYACFVRRYEPDHLARHPRQKVNAMKLLVTAEIPRTRKTRDTNYSFRLGLNIATAPAISTPAAPATISCPKTEATKYTSAAASIATAAGSTWRCRRTTNPRSSGSSGYGSGRTASPTRS